MPTPAGPRRLSQRMAPVNRDSSTKNGHREKLIQLQSMFPSWTEKDLETTLAEANNELELAAERLSSGLATKWKTNKKEQTPAANSDRNPRKEINNTLKKATNKSGGKGKKKIRRERRTNNAKNSEQPTTVEELPTITATSWADILSVTPTPETAALIQKTTSPSVKTKEEESLPDPNINESLDGDELNNAPSVEQHARKATQDNRPLVAHHTGAKKNHKKTAVNTNVEPKTKADIDNIYITNDAKHQVENIRHQKLRTNSKKQVSSKMRQIEAVLLPQNLQPPKAIDVKFGSLSLVDGEDCRPTPEETTPLPTEAGENNADASFAHVQSKVQSIQEYPTYHVIQPAIQPSVQHMYPLPHPSQLSMTPYLFPPHMMNTTNGNPPNMITPYYAPELVSGYHGYYQYLRSIPSNPPMIQHQMGFANYIPYYEEMQPANEHLQSHSQTLSQPMNHFTNDPQRRQTPLNLNQPPYHHQQQQQQQPYSDYSHWKT